MKKIPKLCFLQLSQYTSQTIEDIKKCNVIKVI